MGNNPGCRWTSSITTSPRRGGKRSHGFGQSGGRYRIFEIEVFLSPACRDNPRERGLSALARTEQRNDGVCAQGGSDAMNQAGTAD